MEKQSFQWLRAGYYVFKNEQTMNFNNLNEKKDLNFNNLNKEQDLWSPNLEVSCDMKLEDLNFPRKERRLINFGGCTNSFCKC